MFDREPSALIVDVLLAVQESWAALAAWTEALFWPLVRMLGGDWTLFLALASWAVLVAALSVGWAVWGRDKRTGVIITQYAPPEGVSASECGIIANMRSSGQAFTAALVQMAAIGYWRLGRQDGHYVVTEEDRTAKLFPCEAVIGRVLFADRPVAVFGKGHSARLALARDRFWFELKQSEDRFFHRHSWLVSGANWLAAGGLVAIGLSADLSWSLHLLQLLLFALLWLLVGFSQAAIYGVQESNLMYQGVRWLGAANVVVLIGLLLIGARFGDIPIYSYLYLLASAPLLVIFDHLVREPTAEGRTLMDQIDGFKRYLTLAEKDRLNFHNGPDQTPELFEQYLPYAVALGVEHEWAASFGREAQAASFFGELVESRGNLVVLLASFSPFQRGSGVHKMIYDEMHRPDVPDGKRPDRREIDRKATLDAVAGVLIDVALVQWWR